jgi:hypothetical protein
MILLLETAAVLESRAERAPDPTQAATLRRRAEQRIRDAESIRDVLAAEGVALPLRGAEPVSTARPEQVGQMAPPGRLRRA